MWILETSFAWLDGGQIGEGRAGGQRIPPVRCVVVLTRQVMKRLWQRQDERCYYKGEGIKRLRRNDKRLRRRIPRMTQEMLMSKNWQATVFLPVVKVV